MSKPKNPHWGSSLDSFLDEAGIRKEVDAEARRRVRHWLLEEAQKTAGRRAPAAVSKEQKVGPTLKKATARSKAK